MKKNEKLLVREYAIKYWYCEMGENILNLNLVIRIRIFLNIF